MGLAGCTAMDVISILAKKRMQITGFEVKAHGERADTDPKKFTSFEVEYIMTGKDIDAAAVERAVELSETSTAPSWRPSDPPVPSPGRSRSGRPESRVFPGRAVSSRPAILPGRSIAGAASRPC